MTCIFSLGLYACPDLTAVYASCASTSGDTSNTSVDVIVQQTIENGMDIYTINSKDAQTGEEETAIMIADGKTRIMEEKDPETGITSVQKETYTCKGNLLVGNITLQIGNQQILNITMSSKKVGSEMKTETKGTLMGVEINDLVICR